MAHLKGKHSCAPAILLLAVCLAAAQSLSALGWRASFLPSSATALALAGGGRALPGNMTLSLVSPAHLWGAQSEQLEFGYLRMFGDLAGFGVRWHRYRNGRPVQLVLRSQVEDELELRGPVPTADPLALFSARLLSVTYLWGRRLGATRLGFGLTAAYQRIFEYSGSGFWVSAGWQGEPLPWLRWGLSVDNLGVGESLVAGGDPGSLFSAGAGLAVKTPLWNSYVSLDLGWEETLGPVPTTAWHVPGDVLQLNLSVRWEGEDPLLAAGFQWKYRRWAVAYSYAYQSRVLGLPHMITLGRRL